jgi:hypothetical protein
MKTIYKYPIQITDEQDLEIPHGYPLHVGLDPQGVPCIWFQVNTDHLKSKVKIHIIGTGNPIPDAAIFYIGSFVQSPFVWHVYTS